MFHRKPRSFAVAIGVLPVVAGLAPAQNRPSIPQDLTEPRPYVTNAVEAPEYLSPQTEREFAFPDPQRPWGHPRHWDPDRAQRRWDRHTGFARTYDVGGVRRYYSDFQSYRFGPSVHDQYIDEAVERAYRQGVDDGRHYAEFLNQAQLGLNAYQRALSSGDANFRAGNYSSAARDYLLAAKLNQSDPTARLKAAHAQVALAHFKEAVDLLRRAFELEPRIAYLPMNIRDSYGVASDFDHHANALERACAEDSNNPDLNVLLSYYSFFGGKPQHATVYILKAAEVRGNDNLIQSLREVIVATQPNTPAESTRRRT